MNPSGTDGGGTAAGGTAAPAVGTNGAAVAAAPGWVRSVWIGTAAPCSFSSIC
jgi:hypothetical protein